MATVWQRLCVERRAHPLEPSDGVTADARIDVERRRRPRVPHERLRGGDVDVAR